MADAVDYPQSEPKWPLAENREFMNWYAPVAKKLGIDPDPDAPEHHYDYLSFYNDMKAGKPGVISPDQPGGHFPSDYKTAGHPRTFLPDPAGKVFDTRTAKYLTGQRVPQRTLDLPVDDNPGFDPEKAKAITMALKLSGVVPDQLKAEQARRDAAMAGLINGGRR